MRVIQQNKDRNHNEGGWGREYTNAPMRVIQQNKDRNTSSRNRCTAAPWPMRVIQQNKDRNNQCQPQPPRCVGPKRVIQQNKDRNFVDGFEIGEARSSR